MSVLSEEELTDLCAGKFGDKDPTLMPVYLIGAVYGYFGEVPEREVSNESGMFSDPMFIHQIIEDGMVPISMHSNPSTGLNQSNFHDDGHYFDRDEKGKFRVGFEGLKKAYLEGKQFGEELKKRNPPDGSAAQDSIDSVIPTSRYLQ